jgi:hypothetical protein
MHLSYWYYTILSLVLIQFVGVLVDTLEVDVNSGRIFYMEMD